MNLEKVENALSYTFKNKEFLRRALTLKSADRDFNNEALEFFGDAVLEFIVSEKLFISGGDEGTLTERRKNLVSDVALAPVSERLGLDRFLLKGKNDSGNKKAVPSAYEAVVAAIYLDSGIDSARSFILRTLDFTAVNSQINYKGKLQELLQSEGKACPEYKLVSSDGITHRVRLKIFGKTFYGNGDKIKTAEQLAAKCALEYYDKIRR